jgi:hypothetical protein
MPAQGLSRRLLGRGSLVGRRTFAPFLAAAAAAFMASPKPPPKPAQLAKPVIYGVTFSGNAKNPTIYIHGKGFGGLPPHDPACHPSTDDQCGNWTGYDFGTQLAFRNLSKATGFSAGYFNPELPEMDAVSLMVTKYTNTLIVFHFGDWYTKVGVPELGFLTERGDRFEVIVKGATFYGVVEY